MWYVCVRGPVHQLQERDIPSCDMTSHSSGRFCCSSGVPGSHRTVGGADRLRKGCVDIENNVWCELGART